MGEYKPNPLKLETVELLYTMVRELREKQDMTEDQAWQQMYDWLLFQDETHSFEEWVEAQRNAQ